LVPYLLPQDKADALVIKFKATLQDVIRREITKLDRGGRLSKERAVIEMDTWVKAIMFECSGKTFFGDTWPSDDSEFFNDFYEWDAGLYPLLVNSPSIFTRKTEAARERVYGRFLQILKAPLKNESELVREKIKVIRPGCRTKEKLDAAHDYPIEDTARSFMGISFAFQVLPFLFRFN
jgi:hypothetical protein